MHRSYSNGAAGIALRDELDEAIGNLIAPDALPAAKELGAAMRSYWAEFAYRGDPGRGRKGKLPRWQSWQSGESEPAFLVFDAPADGGIRHSNKIESDAALLNAIATDSRFISACDRCEVIAGRIPGELPNYEVLPQNCGRFVFASGVLNCSVEGVE